MVTLTKYGFLGVTLLFTLCAAGQDTSKHQLPTVIVVESIKESEFITDISAACPTYVISKDKMLSLGTVDVGDAMNYVPGAQLKNYGGIGGIKTVSYRSLGATHTSVSLDHNMQPNTQTGTINLSGFETFGMHRLEFTSGQPHALNALPSAYVMANHIALESELMHADSVVNWKMYQHATSINSYESAFLVQLPIAKKWFTGLQGFGRYGSGEYPFVYELSGDDQEQLRTHADLLRLKGRAVVGYRSENLKVSGSFIYDKNDQLLPGAVILFNPSNDQEIHHENMRGDVNFNWGNEKWRINSNAYHQSNKTRYYDANFLNTDGFLESNYHQNISSLGFTASRKLNYKSERLFFGVDGTNSSLQSDQFDNSPNRLALNAVAGAEKWVGRWRFEGNVTYQSIFDQARSGDTTASIQYNEVSPYLSAAVLPFENKNLRFRFFYKRAFRMPTFNDLYYNLIGNTELEPEDAHLFNLGLSWGKCIVSNSVNHRFELNVDGFYNYVKNKIVAIPTKDLFNWSMQNIGKTDVKGVEVGLAYRLQKDNWEFSATTSHVLNRAVDVTDESSPSYGHQIPYTPFYTSSNSVLFGYQGYKLSTNLQYTGERYSLNENIEANRLDAFFDWNAGIEKSFDLKQIQFSLNTRVMNILNKNYEIIRSFPMPGRYYQLTLRIGNQ